MSGAVKAVGKVFKQVGHAIKKLWQSPIVKAIVIAAAIYFTGGLAAGAFAEAAPAAAGVAAEGAAVGAGAAAEASFAGSLAEGALTAEGATAAGGVAAEGAGALAGEGAVANAMEAGAVDAATGAVGATDLASTVGSGAADVAADGVATTAAGDAATTAAANGSTAANAIAQGNEAIAQGVEAAGNASGEQAMNAALTDPGAADLASTAGSGSTGPGTLWDRIASAGDQFLTRVGDFAKTPQGMNMIGQGMFGAGKGMLDARAMQAQQEWLDQRRKWGSAVPDITGYYTPGVVGRRISRGAGG
jgi:hypothetical protein